MASKRQAGADAATALFEAVPTFDSEAQYIDVSEGSGHEFVPPGPNDLRGVCPGLVCGRFACLQSFVLTRYA